MAVPTAGVGQYHLHISVINHPYLYASTTSNHAPPNQPVISNHHRLATPDQSLWIELTITYVKCDKSPDRSSSSCLIGSVKFSSKLSIAHVSFTEYQSFHPTLSIRLKSTRFILIRNNFILLKYFFSPYPPGNNSSMMNVSKNRRQQRYIFYSASKFSIDRQSLS